MTKKMKAKAALITLQAVADAIRELGEVPAGHLYGAVMGHLSFEQFQKVVGLLVKAGLVRREPGDLLVWSEMT